MRDKLIVVHAKIVSRPRSKREVGVILIREENRYKLIDQQGPMYLLDGQPRRTDRQWSS